MPVSVFQLQSNQPQLAASFQGWTVIYVKQYGAGNLRIAGNKDDLQNTSPLTQAPVADGIAQVTADGWKPYFWSGDLWIISDQNGAAVVVAPSIQFYIDRQNQQPNAVGRSGLSELLFSGSTYK